MPVFQPNLDLLRQIVGPTVTESFTKATPRPWEVDGATVYRLHVPNNPRFEAGQPCLENRLWFHVSAGRSVSREEAEQTARFITYALNAHDTLLAERDRLRAVLEKIRPMLGRVTPDLHIDCDCPACVVDAALTQPEPPQRREK